MLGAVLAVFGGTFYAALPQALVPYDGRPGAPVGQSLGVAAGVLMILAVLYLPAKRSEALTDPNRRLAMAHIIVGSVGAAVALAHSRFVVDQPPILVLLAFLGLLGTGVYGRMIASQRMGPSFGRGGNPFAPSSGPPPDLRAFIELKRAILVRLSPGATEGTFTLSLRLWGRHPVLSLRYYVLHLRERHRMRSLPAADFARMELPERLWRVSHLVLAWLAILGLGAHVVTTLFFAEFAAGGREIYWWHVRK